jgi:hypothetical protein
MTALIGPSGRNFHPQPTLYLHLRGYPWIVPKATRGIRHGLPVNIPGATECLSVRPDGEKARLTNSCAHKILGLSQRKPVPINCLKLEVAPQKSNRVLYGNGIVWAVCHSGVDIRGGECKCAHG